MTKRTERRRRPSVELMEGRTLMTAGALDTTFGGTGIVTHDFGWSVNSGSGSPAVAIQPWDGKAVVSLNSNNHEPGFELARYNPDGSLDTSFGNGGVATAAFSGGAYLSAVVVDPTSHDIYAVGSGPGGQDVAVARFTPAGALDPTFGKGGEVTVGAGRPYTYNSGIAAAVDPSGRLIVAGYAETYDSKTYTYPSVGAVYRFTTTGALDKTFDGTGEVIAPDFDDDDGWTDLQVEPVGSSYQIAVAGVYDNNNALAVYNANGTPVTSVGTNGVATLNATNPELGVLDQFQPDGRLLEVQSGVTAGITTVSINRYNTDGTPDTTFGDGGQATLTVDQIWTINAATVDLSGRILLGGEVPRALPPKYPYFDGILARLTPAGAVDTGFGAGGFVTQAIGSYGNTFTALAVYPAGTSHAGEVLAAGTVVTVPPPSPYDELGLVVYQSDPPAGGTAAPALTAAGGIDPGIAPLVLDSPDLFSLVRKKDRHDR